MPAAYRADTLLAESAVGYRCKPIMLPAKNEELAVVVPWLLQPMNMYCPTVPVLASGKFANTLAGPVALNTPSMYIREAVALKTNA